MAKKQVAKKRNATPQKSPKIPNKTKGISKKTTTINTKNEDRNKIKETTDDDASSEENEDAVAPSSSLEPEEDDGVESDEDVVEKRSSSDEDEEEERETLKSLKEKSKNGGVKNKGKRRSKKEEVESEAEEESNDNNLYRFPMNRVSRIIKSEIPDLKISQEAVFVINRASEKFLQVFCREAYACAFLDNKKHTAYNHLSSVVSRRKRLKFLSDFIPEKVKAEDALAIISKAEEYLRSSFKV